MTLDPVRQARGQVELPGSKSISNRILLLAALSQGPTRILAPLWADDTRVMLDALARLGIDWREEDAGLAIDIQGCGGDVPVKDASLFMGNAGTAIRPLTAVLAAVGGHYQLFGTPRMHERPIRDLVGALRQVGCDVVYAGKDGYPPLHIKPRQPGQQGRHLLRVRGDVSSQFLTALLISAPLLVPDAAGDDALTIEIDGPLISRPYVDMTLNLMARFGVDVTLEGDKLFRVAPGQRYRSPGTIRVEGDASSASYFLAAGAVMGGPVRVVGVGRDSIQGDVRFAEVLEKMGARVERGTDWIEASSSGVLHGIDEDLNHIPDAAMTLAVVALHARGSSRLRNIGSWRVKECDRIAAMAKELRKLGAKVEEGDDDLHIEPPERIQSAEIDTYDDHRMAMCFSLAALAPRAGAQQRITIHDPSCVSKTFPGYFEMFARLT